MRTAQARHRLGSWKRNRSPAHELWKVVNGSYQILVSITNEHGDGQTYFVVFEARSGKRLVERSETEVLAVDVKGDGRMGLLFGGADGQLHAVGEQSGKPQVLWSVRLGRRVGEPKSSVR